MLAFVSVVMTTFLASASTLARHGANDEANPMQVGFEEPESVVRDDPVTNDYPVSATDEDLARPSNAPSLPVEPNNPSQRCGNMLRDLDDLCQYADAGATQATSAAIVSPQ